MRAHVRDIVALAGAVFTLGAINAQDVRQEIATARQTCEQSAPVGNEAARQTCVEKLAQIADRLVSRYRQNGERNDEAMTAINTELKNHPLLSDSDSKKLSKLLIGKWSSPRRRYVFKANGKYGAEDGPMNESWQIKGNQLIEGNSRGTIILLNSDYFIYSQGDAVFFHSRVKE
jgi:hypothetical protein